MSVTVERLERSIVQLEIEVDPDRVEASKDKAVRRISQQVRIPGFRPGKAPRRVIERTLGEGAVLQEALDDLLPEVYSEAVQSEQIEAVGQPEIDIKSADPVVLIARVPVRPTVDLGDYHSLRVPRPEPEERPELVEEALTNIRRRFATYEPVDRPVQWGDTVRADVTVSVEGQGEPHEEEDAEFSVRQGNVVSLPGFLDRIVGLERGGPHEFSVTLPEDFEAQELAGKTATYSVTLKEVKEEVLPDLDDDFARSLDEEGIETLDDLRSRVEEQVRQRAEAEAEARYQEEIVDLLLATADIDYPEVLVEREIDRMVDEASNHAAHTPEGLQEWLESVGQTEEEVRASLRERADLAVRRGIVVGEFAATEGIEVPDERIDEEMDRMLDQILAGAGQVSEEQREQLRPLVDSEEARNSTRNQIMIQMAMERLAEICSQPEEERDEAEAARRRGTRRRRSRERGDEATAEAGEGEAEAEIDEAASAEAGEGDESADSGDSTD